MSIYFALYLEWGRATPRRLLRLTIEPQNELILCMAHSANWQELRNRKKSSTTVRAGRSELHLVRDFHACAVSAQGGSDVPDFDFTSPTSAALMPPLAFTSVRKFDPVAV